MKYELKQGDNAKTLKQYPDNYFDSIVTDPPYGIEFMGKDWDKHTGAVETWNECFRVLKPGGHILAFSASRTYHHLATNIESVGFEIRDQIMWLYGSGFPKSMNIGKAIDKMSGVKFKSKPASGVGFMNPEGRGGYNKTNNQLERVGESTDEAKQWGGWGTALKPAHEPIVMARKPLSENTVAENVLKHGTGGINIDGCRVGLSEGDDPRLGGKGSWKTDKMAKQVYSGGYAGVVSGSSELGRFPANIIHDGSDEVVNNFPITKSGALSKGHKQGKGMFGKIGGDKITGNYGNDKGSASRFFYCPKVSKKERNMGLNEFSTKQTTGGGGLTALKNEEGYYVSASAGGKYGSVKAAQKNHHPTVKPVALMKYLITLITPKGGKVLDPFNGSGSTGMACVELGYEYTGCELDPDYIEISKARIEAWYADNKPAQEEILFAGQ